MNDAIDFNRTYSFDGHEAGYLVDLLQKVYDLRCFEAADDALLGDLIDALDNADRITISD
jgi:hypothetical protein